MEEGEVDEVWEDNYEEGFIKNGGDGEREKERERGSGNI